MQQSGIGLNDLRKNFSKSGIFGFFTASRKEDDASSDEETVPQILEDEHFIRNGQRGVIVLKCHCLKSDRQKILHFHLYTGQIFQYTDGKKKISLSSDICGIIVRSDFTVLVDVKKRSGVSRRIYAFDSYEASAEYRKYIEFRNDIGIIVRSAFDAIDRRGARLITATLLQMALKSMDIKVTEEDINAM